MESALTSYLAGNSDLETEIDFNLQGRPPRVLYLYCDYREYFTKLSGETSDGDFETRPYISYLLP